MYLSKTKQRFIIWQQSSYCWIEKTLLCLSHVRWQNYRRDRYKTEGKVILTHFLLKITILPCYNFDMYNLTITTVTVHIKNAIALTGTVADGSMLSWSIIYWALKQKIITLQELKETLHYKNLKKLRVHFIHSLYTHCPRHVNIYEIFLFKTEFGYTVFIYFILFLPNVFVRSICPYSLLV